MGQDRIELYSRLTLRGRRYYWRARAANGRILADGGEGYNSRDDRDNGLQHATLILMGSPAVEL